MPFQSENQRRYLWANEPEIARDWTDTYGSRIQKDNGGIMGWADQGGMKNYMGEQPMVNAPQNWRAGPNTPPTELAYVTRPERDLILQANMHGSLGQGPNEGPSGIMSLDSQGDYTQDRSPGSATQGRSPTAQANEAHMRSVLTGQQNIGQTAAVSDRVRQGAVPEYARGPDGKMKYIGSAYKSPGQTGGFLSRLFGGQNKYGYAPTYNKRGGFFGLGGQKDIQFNKGAGEYQFKDPRTGNVKPGYGGRILGGLFSLLTGIPFVGGAIGSGIDYGKSIFGQKPKDMSQYRNLGLFGQVPEDYNRIEYYNRDKTPMDRIDPWTNQGITGTDAYETFDDEVALSKMLANPDQLYEEFRANQLAERDFPSDEEIAEERFVGLENMSTYDKVEYNALKKNKALGIKLTPEKEKRLKELQKKRDSKGITEEGTAIV